MLPIEELLQIPLPHSKIVEIEMREAQAFSCERGERVRFMRRIPRYRGIAAEGRDYPCVCHPDYAMPK